MVSKKYWATAILELVDLIKQHKHEYTLEIQNLSFKILPNVFSPLYASDTEWFAEVIVPLVSHKKFLEIGCGTGIIACLAAINNASQVVATDISSFATKNTELNAQMHSLDISIRQGSIFDPIFKGELFDIIFWNHPFYYSEEKNNDMLMASVHDEKYVGLEKFFQEGRNYLTPNGILMLGTSNVARLNLMKQMARRYGYKYSLLAKAIVPIYKGKKVQMDLRIYGFKII